MSKQIKHFKNIEYDYKTVHDSMLMRGLHVNELIDEVNESLGDNYAEQIEAGIVYSIPVGTVSKDRLLLINYTLSNGSIYRAGLIKLLNKESSVSLNNVSFGDAFALAFSASLSGDVILLTLTTDAGEGAIDFSYTKQKIKKP